MVDPAAERAVLAGLFRYGSEAFDDIAGLVDSTSFEDETGRAIFRCAEAHFANHKAPLDWLTLLSAARSLGLEHFFSPADQSKAAAQARYVRAVANCHVNRENISKLANKVRKLAMARQLHEELARASEEMRGVTGDEPTDRILSLAENPVAEMVARLSSGQQGRRMMGDGIEEYIDYLADNPRDSVGVSTGWPMFDRAIGGGLRPNSMDVIVARAKTGKSFACDNVGLSIASRNIPVFSVDTEMTLEEHQQRLLACLTDMPTEEIEKGRYDRDRVKEAGRRLKAMPFHYESVIGKSWEEVLSSIRRWLRKVPRPAVVIYDYLKMMDAGFVKGDLKEYQALGFIAGGLKNLMGAENASCLTFCQTNREGIDREDTDVVSGSDRILHYCTSLTLYKWKTAEERAESDPKYTHKLVPLASRHGKGLVPGDYINVLAEYDKGRITEGPTASQLAKRAVSGKASKQQTESVAL